MSDSHGSSTKAILYALVANSGIAIAKSVGAFFTKSGSMLAEAIHSYADCANQLLLLLGLGQAKKPPTAEHPLGFGKASYFWSFLVAILLFSVGGLFSIYEGMHKLSEAEPLHYVWVALLILGFSILLEIGSMLGCIREINKIRGKKGLWPWLKETRQAELVVIFGEDLAALLGLIMAFVFLLIADMTGDPIYDAIGSICIGVMLLVISILIAVQVKRLLIGRSSDPEIVTEVEAIIANDPAVLEVFNIITLQMGPRLMLAAKVRLEETISVKDAAEKINAIEEGVKARFPEIGWTFMEPDVRD